MIKLELEVQLDQQKLELEKQLSLNRELLFHENQNF
jgi:hypothetical protein